jgi:hypothetical protein
MIKEMPGPVGLQRPTYACKEASVVSNTLIVSTFHWFRWNKQTALNWVINSPEPVKSRDDQETTSCQSVASPAATWHGAMVRPIIDRWAVGDIPTARAE